MFDLFIICNHQNRRARQRALLRSSREDDGSDGNGSGGAEGDATDRDAKRVKNDVSKNTDGGDESMAPVSAQGNDLSLSPIKLGSLDDSLLLNDTANKSLAEMSAEDGDMLRAETVCTGDFAPRISPDVSSGIDINLTHVSPSAEEVDGRSPSAAFVSMPCVQKSQSSKLVEGRAAGTQVMNVASPVSGLSPHLGPAQVQPIMHGAVAHGDGTSIAWQYATPVPLAARSMPTQGWLSPQGAAPFTAPAMPMTYGLPNQVAAMENAARMRASAGGVVSPQPEIVAFGGIENTDYMGVRSSERLRAQPNADATQMERAMLMAQRRDDITGHGYSSSCALDSTMGSLTPGGSAGGYGYWMQPAADGCSGLLFPGYWMASY